MRISILTLFPNMLQGFLNESILKRAQEKKLVEFEIVNIRDFADDSYGTVDNKPYGGGVGMVMRVDVLYRALSSTIPNSLPCHPEFISGSKKILNQVQNDRLSVRHDTKKSKIILTSAKGKTYNQSIAKNYSTLDHLIIIAGHYEGVDERILDYVDEEISVGDYVLTGGELPACIIADSIVRLLPGVLKHQEATDKESFSKLLDKSTTNNQQPATLLEYPQYTRPEEFMGKKVPEVLISGDHKKIEEWRQKKALEETKKKRPDLLKK